MATQYWVGDFFIDLTRNQITQKMYSQTIPPKALAVLTYLAKNANRVVSQNELLAEVWPDTVVTPNTLQRSIAQLRKVLEEDRQHQSYIKTHAKQGYSLEVEVRWQEKTGSGALIGEDPFAKTDINLSVAKYSASDEHQAAIVTRADADHATSDNINIDSAHLKHTRNTTSASATLRLMCIFAAVIILGIIAVNYISPTQPFKLSFGELRSLTATDNKEHSAIYSPDGEYIVFQRYSVEVCTIGTIWAKNTKTQQEIQLTKNLGSYSSHSFSKDGKKLVFIEADNCNKPITQKECYKLMSLDFEKALAAPQSPSVFMECKNSKIASPVWLNNNNVVMFQEFSNGRELASYSIADNKSTVIYSPEKGSLISLAYSVRDDLIALTSIHQDGQSYIEILKPEGQVLSSHRIEYPPEISNLRFIYPKFTPASDQLIFSTGRQLFTLSYKGKITNISFPLVQPIHEPTFHPDGKRMLVTKGNWDSDIATISLSPIKNYPLAQTQTTENNIYPTLEFTIKERSTLKEDDAIFQPNGELIAFRSGRSGNDQIWLTDGNGSQQLSHFPIDTYIHGLNWAADGKSILANVNNVLTQIDLDSNQKSFPFAHRVEQLFQWNSEDNTALLLVRIKGTVKFAEFNLNNSGLKVITDRQINWALKSADGQLIYTDHMDRFWRPGPAEDQLIESLDNQGNNKRFIIKGNLIYGINEEFQLWSYDLNEDRFEILGNTPKTLDYLTGMNQTDILATIRISAKKEVAELILAD
ncbi:winged helix-turn-helix domain-containing protein [Rheinheimera soli]|uniref:DNA-binding winged helix-turn-helix (WHTH) protein/Tol biopolymer transport system component n=1 Tax=Rheinheimera soli TaxID=443616 RepID=A0ABU1W224_9GAMM|nr:winged helix-turn-helix domain-containing protein [Rheinheimera soli]MDR7121890.1 DNA-binding winged helix-turn-helix (wHTH) protein/Tol biopolymer transport system component [Rheinheimera soli]